MLRLFRVFRRFLWLASGFGLGVTAAVRARRAAERALDRLRPSAVVQSSRSRVTDAVATARTTMAQRESELRTVVDARTGPRAPSRAPRSFS
jgi:hypothetical protein